MKIDRLELDRFMLFESFHHNWSPNINVICGYNNTGKTALLKVLYSTIKAHCDVFSDKASPTKEAHNSALARKFQGVFRPDEGNIGRLCARLQGSSKPASIRVVFDDKGESHFTFGSRSQKNVDIHVLPNDSILNANPVYIPPKEIISATENFTSLYDDYHIAFEETYYDLARLLERPRKKGANTIEQNKVLSSFEEIVDGKVYLENNKFYLSVKTKGFFEMGLVSEGFRKLSTIIHLISTGSLSKDSVLFWDEPETNLNPKMIKPICEALVELANMGVQIFITTHDYFVQQSFNMLARYPKANPQKLNVQFVSLYRDRNNVVVHESAANISDLDHNPIMEEFDAIYDREQGYLYDIN